jgi:hypothetical protein
MEQDPEQTPDPNIEVQPYKFSFSGASSEVDQAKVFSFDRSLINGEARRFSANFAHPSSSEKSFRAPPCFLIANRLSI